MSCGPALQAMLNDPQGVATRDGVLYIADSGNHRICMRVQSGAAACCLLLSCAAGELLVLAGSGERGYRNGIGEQTQFSYPCGIALDPAGRLLYVTDYWNHALRVIDVATGSQITVPGVMLPR